MAIRYVRKHMSNKKQSWDEVSGINPQQKVPIKDTFIMFIMFHYVYYECMFNPNADVEYA